MAMVRIRSSVAYNEFITGRDVDSSLHREDFGPGEIIGLVEEATLRDTDTRITQGEYDSLATDIQAYNDALPKEAPRLSGSEQARLDYAATTTIEERTRILARVQGLSE